MPLKRVPKDPSRRAYVLKVRSDATPDALAGRLENLVTGSQLDFASGEELVSSIAHDLQSSGERPVDGAGECSSSLTTNCNMRELKLSASNQGEQ
jgi:hypothetical protein